MGRIFETRKATMFARYDRMAKAFTKAAREIAIAVKAGGDNVEYNPALRRAVQNARSVNMPKDRIEKAIKKALGETGPGYETTYFEGYAPHGVAVMVETATDNNTRTVANVRMHFNKGGGNMGTTGSVGFLFNRMGVFRLEAEGLEDVGLDEVADAGFSHDGYGNRGDDAADHVGVGHAGNATIATNVAGDALEGHDRRRARRLGDAGLLGVHDVEDDAPLEHLGQPALDEPGAGGARARSG